jgi:hypothetical protein
MFKRKINENRIHNKKHKLSNEIDLAQYDCSMTLIMRRLDALETHATDTNIILKQMQIQIEKTQMHIKHLINELDEKINNCNAQIVEISEKLNKPNDWSCSYIN